MIKPIFLLGAFATMLTAVTANLLTQLGPEVHIDRYPSGDVSHIVISKTVTGTNLEIGQVSQH